MDFIYKEIQDRFRRAKTENLVRWPNEEIVRSYQAKIENLLRNPLPYPQERFKGQGIVICGGGEHYFPSAWVCINMLRDLGCMLPIELWYLGAQEMNADMIEFVTPLNVKCVDAHQVAKHYPVRRLHGWALKPYAIMHSQFEEVLYLDADNVPAQNPTFLFSTSEYQEYGAVFWPDDDNTHAKLKPLTQETWDICQVPYRDGAEFESGQLLINKRQCWLSLQVTMHLNEHSDFYYAFFYGDKDTFYLAWHRTKQEYALAPPCKATSFGFLQHDFNKNVLFQHRFEAKWSLQDTTPPIPRFRHDAKCRQFLDGLKKQWSGKVRSIPADFTPVERAAFNELVETQIYWYTSTNWFDQSLLSEGFIIFKPDFTLASDHFLGKWTVSQNQEGQAVVTLRTYELTHCIKAGNQQWCGKNLYDSRIFYELTPINLNKLEPKQRESLKLALKWLEQEQDSLTAHGYNSFDLLIGYQLNVLNNLEAEQRETLELTLKWLKQEQDSLTAPEQCVFEELTHHRLYLYVIHTSPDFMPWIPTQGITAMMRNFTFFSPIDIGFEIGWTLLEHDNGEVVLGLRHDFKIVGFCKRTTDQAWHGTVQILGSRIRIELIPLGWNSLSRLPTLFWTMFVQYRSLIFRGLIAKIG